MPLEQETAVTSQGALDLDDAEATVEAAIADGRVRMIIEPVKGDGWGRMTVPDGFAGEWGQHRNIHVISIPAGGEIRGFNLDDDGVAWVRPPVYSGEWPELNAAVAQHLGVVVAPFTVEPGGGRVTWGSNGETL